jgi:hypothetical protein
MNEDQGNGQGNGQGDGIGDAQEKVQKSRDNRKYKGKGTITFAWNNMKSHRELTIYTLTDDDIDMINYQMRNVAEQIVHQTLEKPE